MKIVGSTVGILVGLTMSLASSCAFGADWPQWRGPQRDGISKETGLAKEWPKDGPKMLWQVKDVGPGYSTPAVSGNRIYVLSSKGTTDEFVQARDVANGQQVWSTRIGKVGNPDQKPSYPTARSTPSVDGDSLYALGSDGDLVCLDVQNGQPRWQKNIRAEFGGKPGNWAYAESPLVDGDVVVCTPGGAQATMVALNKKTGEAVWKSAIPGGEAPGYASIIVVETGGVKQYVQFLSKGLVGVDAKTGSFLWRYEQTAKGSSANIPTPVARDEYVYSAGNRTGGGLVKLAVDGGKVQAQQAYFNNKLPSAIGGSVLVGDHLYGTTAQVLVCADFKTGDIKWTDRAIGAGSILFADGMLYLHGENGEAALVEATPEGYREKGHFAPPGKPEPSASKAWAYPVIADGKLYLREGTSMWCFDVKATQTASAGE